MFSILCYYNNMAKRNGAMHVVTTTRTYKNKTYQTHLLRRSYREGKKVKSENGHRQAPEFSNPVA